MNWKKRLYVTLLGCIIIITFGSIIIYLLDENNYTNSHKAVSSKYDPNNPQLREMPNSFYKVFYTPVVPVRYKAEAYKEISLPEREAIDPKVSPDGSQIVLTSIKENKSIITIVDLTNDKIDMLELGMDNYFDPSWSADGTKLVFAGLKGAVSEIYTYDLKSKNIVQLTQSPRRKKYWPRFSPYQFSDQYRIAYVSEEKGRKDIWWVRESGKDDQPITLPRNAIAEYEKSPYWKNEMAAVPSFVTGGGDSPEWAPSGNLIIYRTGKNRYASLVYDYSKWWQEGALPLPVIKGMLSWAPNHLSLLEYDNIEGKAYILPIDTLQRKDILKDKTVTSAPSLFPDGRGFAYIYEKDGKSILAIEPYDDPYGDIVNLWMYPLDEKQKNKLTKNQLLFLKAKFGHIYSLYDTEYYDEGAEHARPYLVTSDAVLETFYAAFSALLGYAEKVELVEALQEFAKKGLETARETKASNDVENLFLTGLVLIKPGIKENIPPEVQKEIANIRAASGKAKSLFGQDINYENFFIRGKYERDKNLQNYFLALKWFQAFQFDLNKKEDRKTAAEILAVASSPKVAPSLERINLFLKDVIGESRYYTPLTLKGAAEKDTLPELKPELPWIKTEKSLKIFPSIYTLDAFVFDELVTHLDRPETVGTEENPRLLPVGLDIMAAFGSDEAKKILLEEFKEGRFENYEKKLNEITDKISRYSADSREANTYHNWLDMFNSLIKEPPNAPEFTKTKAWKRKQLSTALGSWVNLRYETIAYVEQIASESGEGGFERLNIGMPRGYVEPNPLFFQKLNDCFGRISKRFQQIIKNPELRDAVVDRIDKYRKHLKALETIAQKEIDNVMPTDEEYAEILYIGRTVEHFTLIMGSIGPREEERGLSTAPDNDSLRKVVDVQHAFGEGLYEALGYAHEINVIVPYYGRRQIVRGPVYSYYEFRSGEKWNSEKWKRLESYKLPQWIDNYYEGNASGRRAMPDIFKLRKK
ncbi:MAG: DUF3160 domain-containing protein [Syntrophaceae bacterium]|nr:DUF3160 domain-containing protein [Syntrophaceae bacterium]